MSARISIREPCRLLAFALAMTASSHAVAHSIIEGVSGFQGGLLHPLLVPGEALCMVATALLIGLQPPSRRGQLIAAFVAGFGAGLVLIIAAFASDVAESVLLACGAVIALLVASGREMPPAVTVPLAAAVAAALAFDAVPSTISVADTLLGLTGTALAATLAMGAIAAIVGRLRRPWQRIGVRIAGSWIAAIALLVLTLRWR